MKGSDIYILFAREPVPGRVKTRLAADIGPKAAARLYEAFLTDTLACLANLRCPFAVAYTPEEAGGYFKRVASGAADIFPQHGRGLGERMENSFRKFFEQGYKRIILIGSDIPLLSPEILEDARTALKEYPVVLGPARDGGYYLIGLREPVPGLFTGLPWGSDRVLGDTVSILRHHRRGYHLLPELRDIDQDRDLEGLYAELASRDGRGEYIPERTRRELDRLGKNPPRRRKR